MKEIYVAGGCFWGVEAYFKLIPGIKKTSVGYANSLKKDPSYEEVCSGRTNAVETVKLVYNSKVISLVEIIHFLFRIIDPTSRNKQGGDVGTQYRTGLYFVDPEDEIEINAEVHKLAAYYQKEIVTEVLPLLNFYDAELYHQDYLVKNPGGYCHVNLFELQEHERKINKPRLYRELLKQAEYLFNEESHSLSVLSNISALIKDTFKDVSWVGFYLDDGTKLILGPFQGKVACEVIGYGHGVCGTSFRDEKVVIVPDVDAYPGHISCDEGSKSEIVVPMYDQKGHLLGVLDLDSYKYDYFDEDDGKYLSSLLQLVAKHLVKDALLGGKKK